MAYKLLIAEKPSVAWELAKAVGAATRSDGWYEGNGRLVTWAVGQRYLDATSFKPHD